MGIHTVKPLTVNLCVCMKQVSETIETPNVAGGNTYQQNLLPIVFNQCRGTVDTHGAGIGGRTNAECLAVAQH